MDLTLIYYCLSRVLLLVVLQVTRYILCVLFLS